MRSFEGYFFLVRRFLAEVLFHFAKIDVLFSVAIEPIVILAMKVSDYLQPI